MLLSKLLIRKLLSEDNELNTLGFNAKMILNHKQCD